MSTFVVAGNATRSHPAERGTVHVSISFTSADRTTARSRAIETHNAVVSEAKEHQLSGAATWWNSDRVVVDTLREFVKNSDTTISTVVSYRSRSSIDVRFSDFTALAEWVGSLGDYEGVGIDGIDWALTVALRAELDREVRIAAVQDAITKAGDYAAALGMAGPSLEAVYEEGLRPGLSESGGRWQVQSARIVRAVDYEGGSFELKPSDIDVIASISADFTM
ncbi:MULTISPECIES: SIMPL domain-containing protein [unclassified Frondihabitans]|uniref:SIMPL domain-containing protein n=1 Tax=unclassified Frondihabitans TaxID=2626248 RepID=UPI000F4F8387|nr:MULTISPECIES: SIMPL domain-containing protein [unclassified Frondihabitans]RPE77548.1 hypothetical protein EDF37_0192 [Frondihabitans sp. PhB153]RPF07825.1 hypothetical protein EDF39_0193 [Frondihabitans sp. PhB161]